MGNNEPAVDQSDFRIRGTYGLSPCIHVYIHVHVYLYAHSFIECVCVCMPSSCVVPWCVCV